MTWVRTFFPLALGIAIALGARTSFAQTPADVETARKLFDAGAQAYESGQFTAAIQAFEQANKLVPNPAILFSLAQAQRRQYIVGKDVAHLRAAIANFRTYLKETPTGARKRMDSVQALTELEILESRSGDSAAAARAAAKEPARLMVMTRTPGASVSVDGSAPKPAPLGVEVTPGKHRVRVTAQGYFPEEREPVAVENAIVPVDVVLREMPASLVVRAPNGADVSVDGRVVAEVGKVESIEVPAGSRFVAVTMTGRAPFTQELELGRGERRELDAPLKVTQQRIVAYGLLGVAGVSTVIGGLLALDAVGHQNAAKEIDDKRRTGTITVAERDQYAAEVDLRDSRVRETYVALGVAAGSGIVGGLLWFFDRPNIPPAPSRKREPSEPRAPAAPSEIGVGPGPAIGASFRGRF